MGGDKIVLLDGDDRYYGDGPQMRRGRGRGRGRSY